MAGIGVMGKLVPYRPPKLRAETTAFLGMVIFLGSWAMMFAALFFAYGYVRSRAGIWPPEDLPPLPVLLPAANTAILVLSSAAVQLSIGVVRKARPRLAGPLLLGGIVLGVVFLALQLLVWADLYQDGLTLTMGAYPSVFYGLTSFHALHVLVGLFGLGAVCRKAFAGELNAARYLPLRLWAMYWHFVGIIWALMFVSVFVM